MILVKQNQEMSKLLRRIAKEPDLRINDSADPPESLAIYSKTRKAKSPESHRSRDSRKSYRRVKKRKKSQSQSELLLKFLAGIG